MWQNQWYLSNEASFASSHSIHFWSIRDLNSIKCHSSQLKKHLRCSVPASWRLLLLLLLSHRMDVVSWCVGDCKWLQGHKTWSTSRWPVHAENFMTLATASIAERMGYYIHGQTMPKPCLNTLLTRVLDMGKEVDWQMFGEHMKTPWFPTGMVYPMKIKPCHFWYNKILYPQFEFQT